MFKDPPSNYCQPLTPHLQNLRLVFPSASPLVNKESDIQQSLAVFSYRMGFVAVSTPSRPCQLSRGVLFSVTCPQDGMPILALGSIQTQLWRTVAHSLKQHRFLRIWLVLFQRQRPQRPELICTPKSITWESGWNETGQEFPTPSLFQSSHHKGQNGVSKAGTGLPPIFPTQESNQGLLHCRQMLYQMKGSLEIHNQKASRSKNSDSNSLTPESILLQKWALYIECFLQ